MNSEYKDCQYFFGGKCRCMDYSFNQDFYECPQCKDVPYCYYRQLKKCEQKLEKIKETTKTYRENCKIEGNCLDERLCATCYFGGGLEVCDDILDIIEGAEE